MTIEDVLAQTLDDNGGTFDARTLMPIRNGPWAVGGSLDGFTIDSHYAPSEVPQALTDAILSLREDGAQTIGTWIDEGTLYVDAIDLIEDADDAIRLAAERGERAIYHLTDKITLEVSRR